MTNYEKIKNMSVEEMAYYINDRAYGCVMHIECPCDCKNNHLPKDCLVKIKQWLNMEVGDEF